jgi:hypothetical protein
VSQVDVEGNRQHLILDADAGLPDHDEDVDVESGTSRPVALEPNRRMSSTPLPSALRTRAAKSATAEASDAFSRARRSPLSKSPV